jgi:hypothetical protein
MAITTHHVYNPTGSTVTVNANSVNAHSTKVLTLNDSDAASFQASGCSCAQLMPGTADAAHIVGYTHG